MSPVALSNEEWAEINADLPNVEFVCNRILTWPPVDQISLFEFTPDLASRLRLSNVCFRDAAHNVRNARYALGQAVAVRKYYLARRKAERDNDHLSADVYSRFYADYVPLLLYSASDHTFAGLLELLGQRKSCEKKNGELKTGDSLLKCSHATLAGKGAISNALSIFVQSSARQDIWNYRKKWVHNKPPRVESVFYNPPRHDLIWKMGEITMSTGGVRYSPDYTWEGLIDKLKAALSDTATILNFCADEWENALHQH